MKIYVFDSWRKFMGPVIEHWRALGAGGSGWAAPGNPLKLVPVNLDKVITHAQVWKERGESWREKVRL